MDEKRNRFGDAALLIAAVAVDLAVFWLCSVLGLIPWISAGCCWVLAVCAGYAAAFARQKGFPCALDHFLNRLVYCGLAGVPSLLLDVGLFVLLSRWMPALPAKALSALPAAALFPFCTRALRQPLKRLQGVINEETVSYLFFGVLTTVVNIAIHWLFSEKAGLHPMVSNSIAWVGAVAFAYVSNRRFVFKSRTRGAALRREIGLFLAARLISLGVDEGGMALCLYALHMDNMLSKVLMNVVVIVLNYFASKWLIFKPEDGRG